MSQYIHDSGNFEGVGGLKIFFQFFKPKKYNGVIIYAHDSGEHSGRYIHVIEHFIDKGFSFYGLDHRGNGRSEGKRGHINGMSDYVNDLWTFINIVRKRESDKKYFLLGHSMGGLIGINFVEEHPGLLDGVIVTSLPLKTKTEVLGLREFIGRQLSAFWPRYSLSNEFDPIYLSHDKDVIKKYMEDKLVHNKVTARFFTEMVSAMKSAMQKAENIKTPFLILHAGDDEIADPAGSVEFFEKLGSSDKKLIVYDGFFHEILNEADRQLVYRDIEKWLKPRVD
ncbi:MAG: lysophospholipase [Deltaproteobacteria bacterium]|uniref:Monoacylglycerol lipase n=1 Tax=Candidatus Zymogenus saltonus TaxID=2844893 RepID=A0A9D8KEA0_9DELT|nr:lysophospholipase [Candidatus Zymogenus saltonus]